MTVIGSIEPPPEGPIFVLAVIPVIRGTTRKHFGANSILAFPPDVDEGIAVSVTQYVPA
jgi:hypothetical protein